jgi:hypothetical protein
MINRVLAASRRTLTQRTAATGDAWGGGGILISIRIIWYKESCDERNKSSTRVRYSRPKSIFKFHPHPPETVSLTTSPSETVSLTRPPEYHDLTRCLRPPSPSDTVIRLLNKHHDLTRRLCLRQASQSSSAYQIQINIDIIPGN